MSLLSLESRSEVMTNLGRIDNVISTSDYIYIFELKLNVPAVQALDQIKAKKYYEQFLLKNKPIVLVGLSFYTNDTFRIELVEEVFDRA